MIPRGTQGTQAHTHTHGSADPLNQAELKGLFVSCSLMREESNRGHHIPQTHTHTAKLSAWLTKAFVHFPCCHSPLCSPLVTGAASRQITGLNRSRSTIMKSRAEPQHHWSAKAQPGEEKELEKKDCWQQVLEFWTCLQANHFHIKESIKRNESASLWRGCTEVHTHTSRIGWTDEKKQCTFWC